MSPNGVLLFDEYNDPQWQGANPTVDEFCGECGIPLQSVVKDNDKKIFIILPGM